MALSPMPTLAGELRGVSKSYPEGDARRIVFTDLDLSVPRGRITVVRGPSGTGKSTLLNLLSGIDVPDSGEVFLGGRDLARLGDRERTWIRRVEIGFVFQFFNLVPTLTVLENVRLPLELNGHRTGEADRRAIHWLERVGLAGRAGAYVEALSGGEQQRIAVARALVHEPALVLADEPTGNLDRETGNGVLELLAELVRSQGRTLVMATHSETASALADETVVLSGPQAATVERTTTGDPGGKLGGDLEGYWP